MAAIQFQLGSHRKKQALRLGALALLLAGLPGCQSIDVSGTNVAELRVIDASPDAPGLDFYLNRSILVYNVGFGYNSSYIPLAPGSYTVAADSAGTTQTLVSAGATLTNGHQYTALVGNVNASLQETILQDQTQPAPAGQISFRFLDQNTSVGAVDIYMIPTGGKLMTTAPVETDIDFGTNTGYINIPTGTYAIAVVPTGTVPIATTITLYTGSQITYGGGSVHTIVLIDEQVTTNPAVQVISATDYDPPGSTT